MALRGFLDTTQNRMRFVRAGYDASSGSVPPNQVILDTNDEGTLSIFASGTYYYVGGPSSPTVQIASWSLPYIPLCQFQFSSDNVNWLPYASNIGAAGKISVTAAGIWVSLGGLTGQARYVRWQAFRLPVQ